MLIQTWSPIRKEKRQNKVLLISIFLLEIFITNIQHGPCHSSISLIQFIVLFLLQSMPFFNIFNTVHRLVPVTVHAILQYLKYSSSSCSYYSPCHSSISLIQFIVLFLLQSMPFFNIFNTVHRLVPVTFDISFKRHPFKFCSWHLRWYIWCPDLDLQVTLTT